jgi:hypothetical protein
MFGSWVLQSTRQSPGSEGSVLGHCAKTEYVARCDELLRDRVARQLAPVDALTNSVARLAIHHGYLDGSGGAQRSLLDGTRLDPASPELIDGQMAEGVTADEGDDGAPSSSLRDVARNVRRAAAESWTSGQEIPK